MIPTDKSVGYFRSSLLGLWTNLNAAEKLIHESGYHRRDEELADAKRALLGH